MNGTTFWYCFRVQGHWGSLYLWCGCLRTGVPRACATANSHEGKYAKDRCQMTTAVHCFRSVSFLVRLTWQQLIPCPTLGSPQTPKVPLLVKLQAAPVPRLVIRDARLSVWWLHIYPHENLLPPTRSLCRCCFRCAWCLFPVTLQPLLSRKVLFSLFLKL